jgi:hypothetical protein
MIKEYELNPTRGGTGQKKNTLLSARSNTAI